MQIKITSNDTELTGRIDHDEFAEKLAPHLPVSTTASTYGEEVYFDLPVEMDVEDDATDVVDPGTITFWCEGTAMAIPYGPTPSSHEDECRLAADVNILGELDGDPDRLDNISAGDPISVEEISPAT